MSIVHKVDIILAVVKKTNYNFADYYIKIAYFKNCKT